MNPKEFRDPDYISPPSTIPIITILIITSPSDPRGWSMPRGRPHASWLRQVESYLKDAGMAGLASVWAMARRRPKEYRRKVDAATRCSRVCPHT